MRFFFFCERPCVSLNNMHDVCVCVCVCALGLGEICIATSTTQITCLENVLRETQSAIHKCSGGMCVCVCVQVDGWPCVVLLQVHVSL
jgi:hypothetical protein